MILQGENYSEKKPNKSPTLSSSCGKLNFSSNPKITCLLLHVLVCWLQQSPQVLTSEINEEGLLFGDGPAPDRAQVFLSEISEEDMEVLRERENALLQIEVSI